MVKITENDQFDCFQKRQTSANRWLRIAKYAPFESLKEKITKPAKSLMFWP